MLNTSDKERCRFVCAAQELQKTVAKGTAKPKYENNSNGRYCLIPTGIVATGGQEARVDWPH